LTCACQPPLLKIQLYSQPCSSVRPSVCMATDQGLHHRHAGDGNWNDPGVNAVFSNSGDDLSLMPRRRSESLSQHIKSKHTYELLNAMLAPPRKQPLSEWRQGV
jgi:hypothetical protein